MILLSRGAGIRLTPSISGMFGPYTSASISPTTAPIPARATARLAATVLLPTPPFPLPTARMFLIVSPSIVCRRAWAGTWAVSRRSTVRTPGKACSAARMSASIRSVRGQAGVVRTTVRATRSPSTVTSRTIPKDTISRPSSGSFTRRNTCRTCSDVTIEASCSDQRQCAGTPQPP